MKNLFAYTESRPTFPEFISVNRQDDEADPNNCYVEITVRSKPGLGVAGPQASFRMTLAKFEEFKKALNES